MIGRILLLALLLAPMLAAQEDTCPSVFPPDACDTGAGVGVTATPPPPNCSPCFTVDNMSDNYADDGGSVDHNCQASIASPNSFLLMVADPGGGPPPTVVGVYLVSDDGSCSRDDLTATIAFPAGTIPASKRSECDDTLLYWHTTKAPNQTCENSS